MDPEKSILNRCQEIEYLGFVINSIKNDSSLTPAKEQKILLLFVKVLAEQAGSRFTTEQARIRQVVQLLGSFSNSFIAMPYGKLCYRSLDRCKTKYLVISKENFDESNARFQGSNPGYLMLET